MREQALRGVDEPHPDDLKDERPAWRRWAPHAFAIALLVAVAWLLVDRARKIHWDQVWQSLLQYPVATLLLAVVLATTSQMVYAAYDLLARRYLAHELRPLKVFAVGLVSYAFNLNLGALVGGVAFRWRLYSRLGLDAGDVGRIFALSLVTNWSGYTLLAGVLLATRTLELPPQITLGPELEQVTGIAMLAVVAAYLMLCAGPKRRVLRWRQHRFEMPPEGVAWGQLALSSAHWALTGAVVWVLMPHGLSYGLVLGVLLSAAVAGAMIHVPGGLGVIEAVFVATLSDRVPEHTLVAALLAYRAAFYLLPLAGATVLYFVLEAHARAEARKARATP